MTSPTMLVRASATFENGFMSAKQKHIATPDKMNLVSLATDIAHRGMGPFNGLGKSKGRPRPRDTPWNEITEHLRLLAEKPNVTCVTATQTSYISEKRPGQWYFRVFTGVSYDKVLEHLEKNESIEFEKQRSIVIVRGTHTLNPARYSVIQ